MPRPKGSKNKAPSKKKTPKPREAHKPARALKQRAFLAALRLNHGLQTYACESSGVDQKTFRRWYENDEAFREAIAEIKMDTEDFIENAIFRKINEGDSAMIIFAAKCRLREKGYMDKVEANLPPNIQINYFLPGTSLLPGDGDPAENNLGILPSVDLGKNQSDG